MAVAAVGRAWQAVLQDQPKLELHTVYIQAYCFAPGVNPLQVIVSNGIDWLIGDQ